MPRIAIEIHTADIELMTKHDDYVFANKPHYELSRRKPGPARIDLASGEAILTINLADHPEVMKELLTDKQYQEFATLREERVAKKNKRRRSARTGWEKRKYTQQLAGE